MNIMSFLDEKAISCTVKSTKKDEVIRELVNLLVEAGSLDKKHSDHLTNVLLERESLGSTGIGDGVAIPHGKTDCVDDLVGAFAVSPEGVNFDALDGESVHLFFLLVAPEDSAGPHLKALARISRLLKDKHFRDMLKRSKNADQLLKTIRDEDERRH